MIGQACRHDGSSAGGNENIFGDTVAESGVAAKQDTTEYLRKAQLHISTPPFHYSRVIDCFPPFACFTTGIGPLRPL